VTRVIPVCDRKRCKETATAEILYAEKQEAEQIVVAFTRGQAEYLLQILPTNCTARVIRDQIEQTIAKAEEDAENGHAQD
jgi:PleD family two-component response regulator